MPNDAERFLPTRRSLLTKLKDLDNQDSWREFFETYWRLIYGVAVKSGLSDSEAQDVVQETVLSVAKEMPGFRYDCAQGSFKGWLRQITRRRIADQLRKRCRPAELGVAVSIDAMEGAALPAVADPSSDDLERIWDEEWRCQMRATALERVKKRVKDEHFQIFELFVLQSWNAKEVARALSVSLPLVYWARHKVGDALKEEVKRLESEMGTSSDTTADRRARRSLP